MKIQIKLVPFMDSQSDTEDVDVTNSINLDSDKKGMLNKRKGRQMVRYFNDATLSRIIRWYSPDGYVWVAYDSKNFKLIKFS